MLRSPCRSISPPPARSCQGASQGGIGRFAGRRRIGASKMFGDPAELRSSAQRARSLAQGTTLCGQRTVQLAFAVGIFGFKNLFQLHLPREPEIIGSRIALRGWVVTAPPQRGSIEGPGGVWNATADPKMPLFSGSSDKRRILQDMQIVWFDYIKFFVFKISVSHRFPLLNNLFLL